jgi:hypothetical protein
VGSNQEENDDEKEGQVPNRARTEAATATEISHVSPSK